MLSSTSGLADQTWAEAVLSFENQAACDDRVGDVGLDLSNQKSKHLFALAKPGSFDPCCFD